MHGLRRDAIKAAGKYIPNTSGAEALVENRTIAALKALHHPKTEFLGSLCRRDIDFNVAQPQGKKTAKRNLRPTFGPYPGSFAIRINGTRLRTPTD